MVLDDDGNEIKDPFRIDDIKMRLLDLLDGDYEPPEKIVRAVPRQLKHFDIPAEVYLYPADNKPWTILEVVAADALAGRLGD